MAVSFYANQIRYFTVLEKKNPVVLTFASSAHISIIISQGNSKRQKMLLFPLIIYNITTIKQPLRF